MKPRRRRRTVAARRDEGGRVVFGTAALVASCLIAFAAWFVLQERWIYFWDSSGYWESTIDLAGRMRHDLLGALAAVVRSIRRDDYNLAPVVPLAPAMLVFGEGRLAYILSIAVLCGLPAAASIAFFSVRAFLRPLGTPPVAVAMGVATILVLPALWMPVLAGLPDVIGCIFIPFLWWSVRDGLAPFSTRRIVGVGVALALLVVLRRWYAYWAVAFLVALAVETAWRARGRGRAALISAWTRIAALGAVALLTLLLATGSQGMVMLRTDYSQLYAAYRSAHPLRAAAAGLPRDFGPAWLVLTGAGAVLALRSRRTRALARLLLVQSVVAFVLFARTQSFNAHHYYLLIPQIAVFASVCTATLVGLRAPLWRVVACVTLAVVFTLDFATVFVPGVRDRLGRVADAFPRLVFYPQVRGDLDAVAHLVRELDTLTQDGRRRIYVLSSSVLLNDGVVANAHLIDPSLPVLSDRILPASHVDQRDGFPWGLALARYVVVTDPIGYHLDPGNQRVIGVPAREILSGTTIGRAFVRLPGDLTLDDGSRVLIFERTSEVEKADLDALRDAIAASPGAGVTAP